MRHKDGAIDLLTSPEDFFRQEVTEALTKQKVETRPEVKNYLVGLLNQFVLTENLFVENSTLAELYLRAANSERTRRIELLRRLGDTSLYISGFFGASLERKVVDIDYYKDMGEAAYSNLSICIEEDKSSRVFLEISKKFTPLVDVLTYISEKTSGDSPTNLLRLYEKYIKTGSGLAKDQILERGLTLPLSSDKKIIKQ